MFYALIITVIFAALVAGDAPCGLYLAESTIPNGGWGVFAGKDFELGDHVGQPGIGIPVIDSDKLKEEKVLLQYLWRSYITGGFQEADRVAMFLPGIGSLANYHTGLSNIMEGGFAVDSSTDGASTAYHNHSFILSQNVSAGEELFVGASFLEREEQWNGYPAPSDYERANELVAGLIEFYKRHPDMTDIQWIDLLYRFQHEIIVSEKDEDVKQLLPQTLQELLVMNKNGMRRGQLKEHGLEWVEEHGYCLDLVREAPSTLKMAGRGAFATRAIAKGSVVTPAPLIPINATAFPLEHRGPENVTIQLLGNYCFGNLDVTNAILFCPLSHAGLINHKSDEPNAVIRWGKPSTNRKDADINFLLEDLASVQDHYRSSGGKANAPLMLEIVALTEIDEGEEIFIDYSLGWESAFTSHEKDTPRKGREKDPTPTIQYISKNQVVSPSQALPPGVAYQCRMEPFANEKFRGTVEEEDYRGRSYQYPQNYANYTRIMFCDNNFAMWYPCDIVGSEDKDETFRAILKSKSREVERIVRRYRNLPREALRVVTAPYQSEQHSPSAFRHFVPIPDSLYPARWRPDYENNGDLLLGVPDRGIDVELTENSEEHKLHEEAVRKVKCGNYFAPSNIPEAGFSQYTAVPYVGTGLVIASFMPSIVMPALYKDDHKWIIGDYVWEGKSYKAEYEIGRDMSTEVLGASLANFHPGIVNMKLRKPVFRPVLDACEDPGAGASSDYFGCSFMSNATLQAGEELFISYGDAWFVAREGEFGAIAISESYATSDNILSSIWSLTSLDSEDKVSDMISMVKSTVVKDARTLSALSPIHSSEDLEKAVSRNGTALATMELRSLEWLEENGQCMDHIFVKESSIRQAGNGAFARRLLREGTTIISSPMIHVWGRETMDFNISLVDEGIAINPTMQLLNYQFSHPNSSVYLLPINQMIAINHNSDRSPSGEAPNAKLRWATWNTKSNYVFQRPLHDLKKEKYSTMVMDVVATRDIQPDEEVFIDYGEEWDAAWEEHVRNWRSPCHGSRMSSLFIAEMNDDKFFPKYHEWSDDHFSVCAQQEYSEFVETKPITAEGKENQDSSTQHPQEITLEDEGFKYSSSDARRVPCKIVKADPETETFKVILFYAHRSEVEIHPSMPEKDLEFLPKPYRSDMHLSGAFRHEIKIPDDMFPRHWMDLMDGSAKTTEK